MALDCHISVIVPSYNYAHFLPETLDSVLMQSYSNWECIVVDDGSVDDTKKVVEEYIKKDSRIRYIYQSNKGLAASRNTGIRNANGQYIQLLDADDLIEKNKLESQFNYLQNNTDCSLVYGPIKHFLKNNNQKGLFNDREIPKISGNYSRIVPDLIKDNIFLVSSPLFEKSIFTAIGYFDETLKSLEDWDFWFRYILEGYSFKFLDAENTATLIRSHNENMSSNHKRMWDARCIVRNKINLNLKNKVQKSPDNLDYTKALKDNEYYLLKDKGLFEICFGSVFLGMYYTTRASLKSFKIMRDFKDALYWLKDRIKRNNAK